MNRIKLLDKDCVGFGAFFTTFRISERRVVKVPTPDDTDINMSVLNNLGVSYSQALLLDAWLGSYLPGALRVLGIVDVETPFGDNAKGLLYPYVCSVDEGDTKGIDAFLEAFPHWNFDICEYNFGHYKRRIVRIDTQTRAILEWGYEEYSPLVVSYHCRPERPQYLHIFPLVGPSSS